MELSFFLNSIYNAGPPTIAKLVNIRSIKFGFLLSITIVHGVYQPTYNWGALHRRFVTLDVGASCILVKLNGCAS